MVFRCPNIQAHYNEAVLCLNFGTPENGVPILKHIRVNADFVVFILPHKNVLCDPSTALPLSSLVTEILSTAN